MALRYAAAAAQAHGLTSQGKNLLRCLADNCNENGRALPVIPFGWAGVMNISARTYQRAMKELVGRRLVELPPPGQVQIVSLFLDDTRLAPLHPVAPSQMETEFEDKADDIPAGENVTALPVHELPVEASEPQESVDEIVGEVTIPATVPDGAELDISLDPISGEPVLAIPRDMPATTGGARLLKVTMAFYGHVDADAVNLAAQAWADIEAEESATDGDGRAVVLDLMPQIIHAAELANHWREAEDPGSLTQWLVARQYNAEQYQCASDCLHPTQRPVLDEGAIMAELDVLTTEMGKFFSVPRMTAESLEAYERRVRQRHTVFSKFKETTGHAP